MKTTQKATGQNAFTSTDLIMVIAAVVLVAALVLAAMVRTQRIRLRTTCADNQRQIVLSFKMFTGDSANEFPVEYFTGMRAHRFPANYIPATWEYFGLVSNQLGTAKVLICPKDIARRANTAMGFSNVVDGLAHPSRQTNSISYFLGMGANETSPNTLALGDRNLALDPRSPLYSSWGGVAVNMNTNYMWRSFPQEPFHKNEGVFALSDGSVHLANNDRLQYALLARQFYGTNANKFLFPQ